MIATDKGDVAVQDLQVVDLVQTLDNGLQPIRWIGSRTVQAIGAFKPVCIQRGTLGISRDLVVSPQHRLLLSSALAELYFGENEVLVAANHLVNGATIRLLPGGMVTYWHFLFDGHEVVFSEGIPSESLHPNSNVLRAVSARSRREILELFPELAVKGFEACSIARPSLKKYEASLIAPP